MSLYKAFFKIVKKNLLSILIYSGITVGVILLLSGLYRKKQDEKAILDNYNIYVDDLDQSETSRALTDYLGKIHTISSEKMSDEVIRDNMYYEQIICYIRIPKGFEETFLSTGENKVENTYDDSMPVGISVSLQMNNFLNSLRGYVTTGLSVSDAAKKSEESLDITKYVSIQKSDKLGNGGMKGAFNYMPFGLISILITGIFPVVAKFNEGEKKNRMQVSSMSPGKRTLWVMVGAATFALLILAALVLFSSVMGTTDVGSSTVPGAASGTVSAENTIGVFSGIWWYSVLNALIYTSVVAMMISMFANVPVFAKAPAGVFSNIIGLSFCFLGGTFVPLDVMGDSVKKIGQFLPNYWYSVAVERIYNGKGMADLWDCFVLQLVFGLACLFIGLAAAKLSAEKKQLS